MCKILILYIQDSWTYPTMEHLRNPTREKSWGVVGCMPWWQDLGDDAWNGGRGKIPQQCGQPNAIHLPFTECFIHTNQKDGDDLGMVYYWVVHINMLFFFGCFDGDAFMIWVLATWQNWLPMGAVLTTAWMVKLVACAPCNRWSLLALKSTGRPASSRLHQAFDSMMMGAGCLQGCSPFLGP